MQMTMMATPNINKELHYLNKEDRLLRWLLVKHRDTQFGLDFLGADDVKKELSMFPRSSIYDDEDVDEDDDEEEDEDEDEEDQDQENKVEQE